MDYTGNFISLLFFLGAMSLIILLGIVMAVIVYIILAYDKEVRERPYQHMNALEGAEPFDGHEY